MAWLTMPALLGPVHRAAARRLHHHLLPLALDLLDQHADRRRSGIVLATLYIPDARRGAPRASTRRLRADRGRASRASVRLRHAAGAGSDAGRATVALLWSAGAVCSLLYVRHAAASTPTGASTSALLRMPTFRAASIGGFLFRIGIGATPFLLPLLLQAGFGLTRVPVRACSPSPRASVRWS